MPTDEKHPGGGNITFDFMVSKLAGDKGMSLLMSLMVSVVIGLEFTIILLRQTAYLMIRCLDFSHVF